MLFKTQPEVIIALLTVTNGLTNINGIETELSNKLTYRQCVRQLKRSWLYGWQIVLSIQLPVNRDKSDINRAE
jgi:hypothetical protein